jgi:hypothetical protein
VERNFKKKKKEDRKEGLSMPQIPLRCGMATVLVLAILAAQPVAAVFNLPSYCNFPAPSSNSPRFLTVTFTDASECIRFTQYSTVKVIGGSVASNCSIATACISTLSTLFTTNFTGVGILAFVVGGSNAQVTFGSPVDCAAAANSSAVLTASQSPQTVSSCSSTGVLTIGTPQSQSTYSNLFFAVVNQPSTIGLVDIVGSTSS